MSNRDPATPVRVAIIGAGKVSDYHHVPAIRLDRRCQLVAACDADQKLLDQRRNEWQIDRVTTDYEAICRDPGVDAVVIATPNFTHKPIALSAAKNSKHIMCEKPLGLNAAEVQQMYEAARDANVVHMTAFTYRFEPSMRYLRHLL
jgi:predicted dehydrogenase